MLKRIFTFILILALFQLVNFAWAQNNEIETEKIQKQIIKIENEIRRLLVKLNENPSEEERATYNALISGHEARIKKLILQLKALEKTEVQPAADEEVITEELLTPEAGIQEKETEKEVKKKEPRFRFELGATAGLFADSMAVIGEIRLPLHFIFGSATSSLRFATGLTQNKDVTRKYLPVQLDFILNFPQGVITGLKNYFGAGFNYLALTTGKKQGDFGGQVFYGVESPGFEGIVFGELGLAVLRTGFTPDQKGVTVMLGYRREVQF
jgi:hypothetical protein